MQVIPSIRDCVINDPLALALTFAPELCDYQELPVEVDISGGVSTGKTFADFVITQAETETKSGR